MEKQSKKRNKKENKPKTKEDFLKYEIAEELGLIDKINEGGWKSLTAKESGRIGGLMTTRKKALKK
nr:small, acid-soluble spore protein, alpha/beta type [uncultured Tyzzerella sp.]